MSQALSTVSSANLVLVESQKGAKYLRDTFDSFQGFIEAAAVC